MPSPRGLSPGRGKKAPTSRPGRGQRRCPGSGPVVADTASRESSEVPRGPGFKETGNSFQCREPAPRRSQRPPARGPAPTHRAPKFRRCGPLGGLGPARRSGPRPPGRSRLGRGAGRRLPAPAFQGPGNENADVRPQHGVAGRSPAARKAKLKGEGPFDLVMQRLPEATAEAHSSCAGENTALVGTRGRRLLPRWVIPSGHPGGSKWRPGVSCLHLMVGDPEAHRGESVWSPMSPRLFQGF
ncbi:translation initiation factor IF-2-like [Ursus americanus]|uniref:translation initiation factor IF-2-like n=1 Tax=Ursus americanus TaxID=9643 RepID=UPI001E67C3B1|nr:translation initiation factor IF-2-like [Ursus americanus]